MIHPGFTMCAGLPSFYERRIMPCLVHNGCAMRAFSRMRARTVPQARGVVVEVGFGSGLNLPYYDPARVERLIGIDPDARMLAIARRRIGDFPPAVELVEAGAERMPLPTRCVDTAVVTYALCTIPDPAAALDEIRRVLKPEGRLLFIEHGRSEVPWCGRWQDRLNGVWGRIAGGCRLNRDPLRLIEDAGFVIRARERERFPLHLWPLGCQWMGEASPALPATADRKAQSRRPAVKRPAPDASIGATSDPPFTRSAWSAPQTD
jgi:ubiquinone/menaquinone biosynthesis C-methylase UbiE